VCPSTINNMPHFSPVHSFPSQMTLPQSHWIMCTTVTENGAFRDVWSLYFYSAVTFWRWPLVLYTLILLSQYLSTQSFEKITYSRQAKRVESNCSVNCHQSLNMTTRRALWLACKLWTTHNINEANWMWTKHSTNESYTVGCRQRQN